MIKAEEQVCDISHAKRLKTLGVAQESLFHWYDLDTGNNVDHLIYVNDHMDEKIDLYSAYTVAELGRMLPTRITHYSQRSGTDLDYFLRFHKDATNPRFSVWYETQEYAPHKSEKLFDTYRSDEKEANSRAQMLILLLENNLGSIGIINKRLNG